MSEKRINLDVLIITEGIAGTENQCRGVCAALNVDPTVKKVSLNQPWAKLSPYLKFEKSFTFSPALHPPWPDLLITSGRKSIAASRYIKKHNPKTVTIHIQDPRISPKHFDLVCVPKHDPTRGENVFVTDAAPNMINGALLENSKSDFPQFEQLPSPRIGVLIGGKSKAYDMSAAATQKIATQLSTLQGSLMITCSRRTGQENRHILETALKKETNYFWNDEGQNPYHAILAWADYLIVTADSTSMISECATTGKPVYVIHMDGGAPRIKAMHEHLNDLGVIRTFEGTLDPFAYTPLNDAQKIANEIKRRFTGFTPFVE